MKRAAIAEIPHYSEVVVRLFENLAQPILACFPNRNSCVEQTRVVVEVMRAFKLKAVPKPVKLMVKAPGYAYVSGLDAEERGRAQATAGEFIEKSPMDGGFPGHLCAVVERRWMIDTTLDQASCPAKGVEIPPVIMVYPLAREINPDDIALDARMENDAGLALEVRYLPLHDHSFLTSEAWEKDHLLPAIGAICHRMRQAAGLLLDANIRKNGRAM